MVTRDVDDVHVSAKLSCNGHRRKFAPGIEGMDWRAHPSCPDTRPPLERVSGPDRCGPPFRHGNRRRWRERPSSGARTFLGRVPRRAARGRSAVLEVIPVIRRDDASLEPLELQKEQRTW